MLDWIVQNKWKFLLLYVFKIALFFPYTAYADTQYIPFTVDNNGGIFFTCPDTTITEYTTYFIGNSNTFPTTTSIVDSGTNTNILCSSVQGESMEGGWYNNFASPTGDGYYAIVFNVNSQTDPDYTIILQRVNAIWYAGIDTTEYIGLTSVVSSTTMQAKLPTKTKVDSILGNHGNTKIKGEIYKTLPANLSNATNTEKCEGFTSNVNNWLYDTYDTNTLTGKNINGTGNGYADCSTNGTYYVIYTDSTFPTKNIAWYGQYTWTGTSTIIGTFTPTVQLNCNDPTTRILDFSPYEGVTLTDNVVNFSLDACINEDDIGNVSGVNITLHNIDQNVLLVNEFSPSDIWLLRDRNIQQSGLYNFSTTSILGDGNYRIEACIERSYLFGFIRNPFGDVTDCQSHQFIVVQGTFIGNVSQNLWGDTNALFNGLSATSSEALAHTCNPIGGDFDIRTCLVYLFVPDGNELKKTMENARDGFLSRFPIGYITRFVTIVNSSATTTLPAFSIPVQVGNGTETIYVSMDTGETIRGGGELLDSVRDPFYNKSVRDIFEPWVQGSVALMVLMTIIGTELRAHREEEREIKRKGKLS